MLERYLPFLIQGSIVVMRPLAIFRGELHTVLMIWVLDAQINKYGLNLLLIAVV